MINRHLSHSILSVNASITRILPVCDLGTWRIVGNSEIEPSTEIRASQVTVCPSTSHSSSVAKSQARIAMKEDKDEANGIADSMRQDWYPKVASTQQIGNDWNECEKRNIDHTSDTLIVMH